MRYLMSVLVMAVSVAAIAGEEVDKTLKVRADGIVDIEVVQGDITLETWSKSEVRVVGELDDDTEEFIFKTKDGETTIRVDIESGFFNRRRHGRGSSLKIYIPVKSSVEAEGVSTDYKMSGVKGGVVLETVSGDINLAEIAKHLDIESVSGDVVIADSEAEMKVETVSGDIEIEGDADDLEVDSVSGDVAAEIGQTNAVEVSAVSGDIDISLELAKNARVKIETVSGDVTTGFHGKINARFDLETGPGGDIENHITSDEPDSSMVSAEHLKFKVGDGSGAVIIDTMSGTIFVKN